ncbi:MAG: PilZ domain-containing protein [Planctomycetes bacterium]|nr:PilZ domain-containing protein [Planctomycetota bacterium]
MSKQTMDDREMNVQDAISECLELAAQLEQRGEFESAIPLYEQAEASGARSWIPHSRHLQTLHLLGRLSEAEELVSDYLRRNPDPPGAALNDFGVLKAEQGKFTDAIKCFFRALRSPHPPAPALVLGSLAYVLYVENRMPECAKVCDRVLRLDPDELRAHYILSLVESRSLCEAQRRPAAGMVCDGARVEAFPFLCLDGQPPAKHRARIEGDFPAVHLEDPAARSGAGKHWGVLLRSGDDTWCGLSEPLGSAANEARLVLRVPTEFCLVQRRRWVRVLATGSIARLEVRSFPPGVAPFEVQEIVELNLSGGGAAVRTVPELPRGTEVVLVLKLDETEQIEVSARVSRIGRPSAAEPYSGLSFVELSESNREKIARFVHQVQLDRKRGKAHVVRA